MPVRTVWEATRTGKFHATRAARSDSEEWLGEAISRTVWSSIGLLSKPVETADDD